MDSREILHQFITGSLNSSAAFSELDKLINDAVSLSEYQEAARARYAAGFIRRADQFRRHEASARDFCLNLRDIILFLGRIKLNEKLYNAAREHGSEFGLVCENDLNVSCLFSLPKWLSPDKSIRDVYAMAPGEFHSLDLPSIGDEILRSNTYFTSYKSFEQKLAIHTALNLPNGHTLLVSQPTGGGKSLITQILSAVSEGLTVVIVPTVALALDQYYAAKKHLRSNSEIYCYRGDQNNDERFEIIKAIRENRARLLFSSPEAIFKNTELFHLLEKAAEDHRISNIVVDEAHVVPDWGVFFRPDFQMFSIILKKWKSLSDNMIRTFLLSATLSDEVVDSLFTLFGSEGANTQLRCDALRQEPRFYFQSVKSKKEQYDKAIEAIRLLPKPMVVYVLEPREANDLQKRLFNEGYLNIPTFSGDTKDLERDTILNGWKNHEYDVIIATSAFGIGVDKPDVRTIIHACCPENLSRFYQEVGRGGRDRLPSLSIFMPYQSSHDKDGDVHRAHGLVNKRVLTVDRGVVRWNSMISSPSAIIDGDECTLDTSVAPPDKNDETPDYAGNKNVAWNVNLLLFLHRTGFIELFDVEYISQNKSYSVKAKLKKPDILGDTELMKEALQTPRETEYQAQMQGYYIIRDLVASPKSNCWGKIFARLFPLSDIVCSGCPNTPEGRISSDTDYKLREAPKTQPEPAQPALRLHRHMKNFSELLVLRQSKGTCTAEELAPLCERASLCGIGVIVVPVHITECTGFCGLVLSYDEFNFVVNKAPYLFAKGVLCVMENNNPVNITLYKNLCRLKPFGYRRILYCNDNSIITHNNRTALDYVEGHTITAERL